MTKTGDPITDFRFTRAQAIETGFLQAHELDLAERRQLGHVPGQPLDCTELSVTWCGVCIADMGSIPYKGGYALRCRLSQAMKIEEGLLELSEEQEGKARAATRAARRKVLASIGEALSREEREAALKR